MSDRSDEPGPTPETPGTERDAANPPPAPSGDPDAPERTPEPTQTPPPEATATPPQPHHTTSPANEYPAGRSNGHAATHTRPALAATGPEPADRDTAASNHDLPPRAAAGPLQHTAILDRPNGTPFLAAQDLTATGRQGRIFTDITVTAGLGQLVALCGDGGEGRSSLLLALTGRFPFHRGTLHVDGQTKPGHIRRRFTIAQAGPPIRLDPYATVGSCIKETITVSNGTATRTNINAWLDRLAVGVDTGDTFGFLPRIDQIRFTIACAAAARTPAIAVDDADTGLDTCGSERVFDALRTVADAGQLVLAVCTRSDPPADTVVDLRAQPAPTASAHHGRDRNGGHR
ncbi:hypothetical protein [Glycomyces sp. YM15]|uniref:hypothetical protein n=1 Tax=Glycomyces sp. YM15 TaxID=2800446 RepID=UPI0019635664|nr:hypothetical protein [Glycomyces sp. YM15]